MKITISISDRIFRAAEKAAEHLKVSRSRFYAQAIDAYLKALSDSDITEKLNTVYATEDSSLDLVMARIQTLSIGHEKW